MQVHAAIEGSEAELTDLNKQHASHSHVDEWTVNMPRGLHYHSRPVFVLQPNFNVEDIFSTINSACLRRLRHISRLMNKSKLDKDIQRFYIPASPASFGPCNVKNMLISGRLQNPGLRVVSSTIQAKSKKPEEIIEIWSSLNISIYSIYHHMLQLSRTLSAYHVANETTSSKFDPKSPKMWHLVKEMSDGSRQSMLLVEFQTLPNPTACKISFYTMLCPSNP